MAQTDSQVWFQRIFHPSDFSDASNIAFVHALKLAVLANGRLTILHTGLDYREQPLSKLRLLQSRRRVYLRSQYGIFPIRSGFLQTEHLGIHRFERR
jgi:hypothetical protein